MKKFTLLALSTLVIPGLALADTYVCPSAGEAQTIISGGLKSWNGWTVISASGPVADNGTFLYAIAPGKNVVPATGQTSLSVNCTYSAAPYSVLKEAFVTLTHDNLATFQGVTGAWVDAGFGWLQCMGNGGNNPEQQCQFADSPVSRS